MLKMQLEQQGKAVDTLIGNMRVLENKLAGAWLIATGGSSRAVFVGWDWCSSCQQQGKQAASLSAGLLPTHISPSASLGYRGQDEEGHA